MTSPIQDPKAVALATIRAAAQSNTAASSHLGLGVYAAAGMTGLSADSLASYNSALDSAAIHGAAANSTAEVQSIVSAFNKIALYTRGYADTSLPVPAAADYAAIGVTGLHGAVTASGTALNLMNQSLFRMNPKNADTVPELQAMANAAKHVMAAAGGTVKQAAALSVQDLTSLGVTGVTSDNLAVVQTVIRSVSSDTQVDTRNEIQDLINAKLGASLNSALANLSAAAEHNTAVGSHLSANIYSAASVTGVSTANLASVNSALDSARVNGAAADTSAEVQTIANAYNAILANADGVHGNAKLSLTLAQFAAIGVTGVSDAVAIPHLVTDSGVYLFGINADKNADLQTGSVTDPSTGLTLNIVIPNGSDWHLLNDVVDASARSAVDAVGEVQAMATAANHVIAAAGGTMEQVAAVTLADLQSLGIHGVTAANLVTVQAALELTGSDYAVDTQAELQSLVNAALAMAPSALHTISAAAEFNTATASMLSLVLFGLAGVTGVNFANIGAIDSALDSGHVTGALADTIAEVQAIVDAYNAILHSADGVGGNTVTPLTAAQYSTIGVVGLSGTATAGSAMSLLNSAVDAKTISGVNTVGELQAMADAAAQVMTSGGGFGEFPRSSASLMDFQALGVTGVTAENLSQIQVLIGQTTHNTHFDTLPELQQAIDAVIVHPISVLPLISSVAVQQLSSAAEFNSTSGHADTPGLPVELYTTAAVKGVTVDNVNSINSALDSSTVDGAQTDTTAKLQTVVDAYNAILHSADGVAGNTAVALTSAQFGAIGVTGVNGSASEGTALHLLNDVVDSFAKTGFDTVPELQAMANAAAHIIAAAGGTLAAARAITHADLFALGIGYGDESSVTNFQDALHALTSSAAVDTRDELGNLAQATQLTVHFAELLPPVEPPQPVICYFDPLQNMQPSGPPVMVA
jgi:hypothetical protein